MNCDLDGNSWLSNNINDFVDQYKLLVCNCVDEDSTDSINYTYFHESLGHYSRLDYFLISTCLADKVVSSKITDNVLNMSDHLPLKGSM